jgi:hypothetical protein
VTSHVAIHEPDPYLAQIYRYGLLEDFDHLYRYSALLDRLEGKDANTILQSYTDVRPGRPTREEHRAPENDLRRPYDRTRAAALSKLNALTIVAGENQTHDYYMHVGPLFSDPVARQLYAEIASIEEQHVTQYEAMTDPAETWLGERPPRRPRDDRGEDLLPGDEGRPDRGAAPGSGRGAPVDQADRRRPRRAGRDRRRGRGEDVGP